MGTTMAHISLLDSYKTGNGNYCILFCSPMTEEPWHAFAKTMGKEELIEDPKFCNNKARCANRAELDGIILDWMSQYTNIEVMEKCGANGVVTAGTSSQTSDGAGFVVMMSEEKARELSIEPIAHFIGFAVAGCEPGYMGEGPIYAVPKVMAQTDLTVDDMDVIELNEAFAAQAIPCMRTLKMNPDKVNPNGGALALGHPLGATGAFLSCKILNELHRTGGRNACFSGKESAGLSLGREWMWLDS